MQKNNTVVLLGGTGFVGRALIPKLAAAGYRIVVPTRNRERARELMVIPEVKLVTADIHDRAVLGTIVGDADTVINLVGILNEKGHHRGRGFYVAHRDLTESIIAVCREQGVGRLLQMSALKANAKEGPSHYLKSKGEAERAVRAIDELPRWTIFQPSVVFGPDDTFLNRFADLLKLAPIMPLARPNARFAPVFVDDVAQAFVNALADDATHGQTYQLCGPKVYSLRELVNYVRELIGVRRPIVGLPDALAKAQASIFGLLPGKPFSMDNYRSLTVHSICDKNGLSALGIDATPLEAIAPRYLAGRQVARDLDRLRKRASR